MNYQDLINTIKQYDGNLIEIIMDTNFNNHWFLMIIKEDFMKFGYQIINSVNIFNFKELNEYTKSINKKTIIFVNYIYNTDFSDELIENNENCTIIFLRKYIKSPYPMTFNKLSYLSSLVISIVSNKVSIIKSRYGTTKDMYFYYSKLVRKLKLKKLKIVNS